MNTTPEDKSVTEQIDDIITKHSGWKGDIVAALRTVITQADPDVVEEIKWRMATRPEGLAVWSHDGILCFAEIWKDNVKILFTKGEHLKDPKNLFNARLKSKDIRAIEFREGDRVDEVGLRALVLEAVRFNEAKVGK